MGSREKRVLKVARRKNSISPRSSQRDLFKRLTEEKGWLDMRRKGVFTISDKGLKALAEREDTGEDKEMGQRGLGEFS